MNLVTRDRPNSPAAAAAVVAAVVAATEVQPTNCDSCIHIGEHVIARAVTDRIGRTGSVGLVIVCRKLWEYSHTQASSTRPIARHIINDRDHAACVLRVSYCGRMHKRRHEDGVRSTVCRRERAGSLVNSVIWKGSTYTVCTCGPLPRSRNHSHDRIDIV